MHVRGRVFWHLDLWHHDAQPSLLDGSFAFSLTHSSSNSVHIQQHYIAQPFALLSQFPLIYDEPCVQLTTTSMAITTYICIYIYSLIEKKMIWKTGLIQPIHSMTNIYIIRHCYVFSNMKTSVSSDFLLLKVIEMILLYRTQNNYLWKYHFFYQIVVLGTKLSNDTTVSWQHCPNKICNSWYR